MTDSRAGDDVDDRDQGATGGTDDTTDAAAEVVGDDLAALERERSDLVDTLRRVQADFENYRKRVMREQSELTLRATDRLLEQLLPVLDSFELALGSLDADEQVRKGVELVYGEFLGVLEKAGLQRIEADGEHFDPTVHEAVLQAEGEGEPVVAETMRTGYRVNDRVLRPAMVKVDRK